MIRSRAKAGAAVEPIIIAEFVDLDTFLTRGRMRHVLCHHQRLGIPLHGESVICDQIWSKFEMLLKGKLSGFAMTEDRERRHDFQLRPV
jgi:hypothetical protein